MWGHPAKCFSSAWLLKKSGPPARANLGAALHFPFLPTIVHGLLRSVSKGCSIAQAQLNKESCMNRMLAERVLQSLERSSWIRRMFEAGAELKAKHGADNVYDFSLGNPDLSPPESVAMGLRELADSILAPYSLGYMPNAGYAKVREEVAKHLCSEQQASLTAEDVLMTCGAAGGINALFRAVLDPEDEVLCPAPYFVEYGFYAQNHGGTLKAVPCLKGTFSLDIQAIAAAITVKTRVVLINSPNNPSGQVYGEDELAALAEVLTQASEEFGRPIYLLSDEPYRFLVYDNIIVPPVLTTYPYSLVVNSFSKSLSLAGERVGYLALNPAMPEKKTLMNGLILANRILGFVNAPALGQLLAARAIESRVDVSVYTRRRDIMSRILDEAGYDFTPPKGGFYFFPEAPGGDDIAFVAALQEERILAVPGTGFGCPGYFRLAFCCPAETIQRAAQGFARARKRFD